MDLELVLNTMRDPAGIPADPLLMQVLMVFTWVFHIAFVQLSLGAAGLSLFAFVQRQRGTYWARLSMAMTKVAKVSISLTIVLGVAPLLFTQVIYDPQWYTSNVLSAAWAITFIFTLIVAYCLWFAFYLGNRESAKQHIGLYAGISIVLLLLDGLIMHVLAYQALLPDQWLGWYAPDGVVNTSGTGLHAIQWPRFLFIISLSVPALGIFLLVYSDYLSVRPDLKPEYLQFTRSLGQKLALVGLVISFLFLVWWQLDHPQSTGLSTHPMGWLLAVSLVVLWWVVRRYGTGQHGYALAAGAFGIIALLAIWRELIRIRHMAPFDYTIYNYPVHVDWPSLGLFLLTLIGVGGMVGGFYLTTLYRAGRVRGEYVAETSVARLATAAVFMLVLWIGIFYVYGITIWVGNAFN